MPRDEVSVDEAYAAALVEIGRLHQRVILCQALITRIRKEGCDAEEDSGSPGNVRGDYSPHHFSD